MTDLDLLLRAVLECPDDDTPRLLFADALEEAGEPDRAEFIRLQIAGPVPDGTKSWDYPERQRRLWARLRLKQEPDRLLPLFAGTGVDCYVRGFVERVTCAADDWLAHADAILRQHPVRAVTLTTWPRADLAPGSRPGSFAIRATSPEWLARYLAERWPRIAFTPPPGT